MTDLIALALRVEALTGPCRETDHAIYAALNPDSPLPEGGRLLPWAHCFTDSLDAAMTLVPEGCRFVVSTEEPGPWAWVGVSGEDTVATMAASPALALTAAALRARAAMETTDDE